MDLQIPFCSATRSYYHGVNSHSTPPLTITVYQLVTRYIPQPITPFVTIKINNGVFLSLSLVILDYRIFTSDVTNLWFSQFDLVSGTRPAIYKHIAFNISNTDRKMLLGLLHVCDTQPTSSIISNNKYYQNNRRFCQWPFTLLLVSFHCSIHVIIFSRFSSMLSGVLLGNS